MNCCFIEDAFTFGLCYSTLSDTAVMSPPHRQPRGKGVKSFVLFFGHDEKEGQKVKWHLEEFAP